MEFSNLSKTYGELKAVDHASIRLQPGSIQGLLGANGAGKSTLIKMLLGLVHPDRSDAADTSFSSQHIAFVPELPYLPMTLSALQATSHAARISSGNTDSATRALETVKLNPAFWNKPIRSYSKGMQQRTAIAFALAGGAKWLVLDEPMSGLDALGRKEMLEVFLQLKDDGVGILMCSHSVPDLIRACDQASIMVRGKICKTVEITEHSLEEAERLEALLADLNQQPDE